MGILKIKCILVIEGQVAGVALAAARLAAASAFAFKLDSAPATQQTRGSKIFFSSEPPALQPGWVTSENQRDLCAGPCGRARVGNIWRPRQESCIDRGDRRAVAERTPGWPERGEAGVTQTTCGQGLTQRRCYSST